MGKLATDLPIYHNQQQPEQEVDGVVDARPSQPVHRTLADFCQHLDALRRTLNDPSTSAALEEAAAAGARGEPLDPPLVEILRLRGAPFNPSDGIPALTALLWHLGFPYSTTRDDRPERWSRILLPGGGHPRIKVYVCPSGRCDRLWTREPGVAIPTCWIEKVQLRERT